jgi:mono/diheme cytochrome c family protein
MFGRAPFRFGQRTPMLGQKYKLWGVPRMTRATAVLLLCCITSPAVFAQSSDPDQLSDKERLGWRLYEQSCSICHTKPNLVLHQFGPVLSRESLNGRPELVREVIANGTPRMPGFKHHFAPAEIDAIAAYLQTLSPAEKR